MLAWPVALLTGLSEETTFDDIAIRTTQIIGLLFALAYLHTAGRLSWNALGWRSDGRAGLLRGFLAGIAVLTALSASLYLLGIHAVIPGRDYSVPAIAVLLLKALVTGLAVAVFEETLFRGALQGGLMRRTRHTAAAVIAVSLAYAAVHFLDYPPLAADEGLGWMTGPSRFPVVLAGLFDPATLDAFLALFMLGVLLGMMRLRSGHILACIGFHAGVVAMIKISRYFLAYEQGSGLGFLVSVHDHRIGYLAFLWLALATVVYFLYDRMKYSVHNKTPPA